MAETDLERRHRALIERDRLIGLRAEAEAARAHAAHVQAELDVARARLARKNSRIEQLAARVAELESAAGPSAGGRLRPGLARLARLVRR